MKYTKGDIFQGFTISGLVKEGIYSDAYRVKDSTGKNFLLKLIDHSKVHPTQIDKDGQISEKAIVEALVNDSVCHVYQSGTLILDDNRYTYLLFDYIVGESLADKVTREQRCSVYDCKRYTLNVLEGLKFLHSQEIPIVHNGISIQNVMLDMSVNPPTGKLIGFSHARRMKSGMRPVAWTDENPFYLAPERFNGVYSQSTDLYSVGVMMYHLIFGRTPWYFDISRYDNNDELAAELVERKQKGIKQLDTEEVFELDEQVINIILRATSYNPKERFQSASEFISALKDEYKVSSPDTSIYSAKTSNEDRNVKTGNGFADVAGMTALKEQLKSDVIELMKHPDEAKELGLSMPNGILFYGPPGCGKTFFAEKFAEEAGYNYMYVDCSNIASPYIHGGQKEIASIFDEARKKAPTILFLDEIEAMIMDRSKHNNASESGEVNVFLTQLNNCGQKGVMVIGACNNPLDIDKAAIRAGRLELKYYISQPDADTREQIFKLQLKNRSKDLDIDYKKLASLTENYISADIKLIVEQAARKVFREKIGKITMTVLVDVIKQSKPSLPNSVIKRYEAIHQEFTTGKKPTSERPRIGF